MGHTHFSVSIAWMKYLHTIYVTVELLVQVKPRHDEVN